MEVSNSLVVAEVHGVASSVAVKSRRRTGVKASGWVGALLCLALTQQSAAAACLVSGPSLSSARAAYQASCSQPRKDCDPVDGVWYCSSESVDAASIASLSSAPASGGNGEPSAGSNNSGSAADNASQSTVNSGESDSDGNSDASSSDARDQAALSANTQCADPDGDGWGWTGTASCRVAASNSSRSADNATVQPVTVGECVDPDNDGWGWNGSASCRIAGSANTGSTGNSDSTKSGDSGHYYPADITDLILVTGQSNALGANTSYDPQLDSPHKRVFAFTDSGWQRADLHQIWDLGWHPRNHPDTDPSNNFSLHFGKRLTSLDSNRVVGFILATAPGAAISNWSYNGVFYREIRTKVLDGINQLPHKSSLDGILWHQGETDANDTQAYANSLNALIANFRSESWYSSGKPFICGEIAVPGGVNNRLNALNSDGDSNTACVPATDLPTKPDRAHFTAEALRAIGKRYAEQYNRMTN